MRKLVLLAVLVLIALASLPAALAQSATANVEVKADKTVVISLSPTSYTIIVDMRQVPPGGSKEFFSGHGKLTVATNYPIKVISDAEVPRELSGRFWLYVDGKRYKPDGWADSVKMGVKAYEVWFSVVADWYLPAGEYRAAVTFTVVAS